MTKYQGSKFTLRRTGKCGKCDGEGRVWVAGKDPQFGYRTEILVQCEHCGGRGTFATGRDHVGMDPREDFGADR